MSAHYDKYADKRPRRRRRCTRSDGVAKQRFPDEATALLKASRFNHDGLRAYECVDCGFWHIGKR